MSDKKIAIEMTKAQWDTIVYALQRTQRDFEPYPSPTLDALIDHIINVQHWHGVAS